MLRKEKLRGEVFLLLATVLWGAAMAAQTVADRWLPPFSVNAIRMLLGALGLFPVIAIRSAITKEPLIPADRTERKSLWIGGLICGALLAFAVNFQQVGISLYPKDIAITGRSGFITTQYVVLVPIIGKLFGHRPRKFIWIGVALAVVGMYLMCFGGGIDHLYSGDALMFLCALAFAFQILAIDHFVEKTDCLRLSMLQFFFCGIISAVLALFFEEPMATDVYEARFALLYLGLVSCAVAYTLQTAGQKTVSPPLAGVTMSLESVFAAIVGVLLFHEAFTLNEWLGSAFLLAAVFVTQLPTLFIHAPENPNDNRKDVS